MLTFFVSLLTNLLGPWSRQLCYFQGIWFLVFSFVKRVEAMREEAPRAKKMLRKKILNEAKIMNHPNHEKQGRV